MSDKPEALRLAAVAIFDRSIGWQADATAELRRLYAENEALRNVSNRGGHLAVAWSEVDRLYSQRDALLEALKAMLHMVERHAPAGLAPTQDSPVAKARAAIKAAEEGK